MILSYAPLSLITILEKASNKLNEQPGSRHLPSGSRSLSMPNFSWAIRKACSRFASLSFSSRSSQLKNSGLKRIQKNITIKNSEKYSLIPLFQIQDSNICQLSSRSLDVGYLFRQDVRKKLLNRKISHRFSHN